jgi:hypothetical protein
MKVSVEEKEFYLLISGSWEKKTLEFYGGRIDTWWYHKTRKLNMMLNDAYRYEVQRLK